MGIIRKERSDGQILRCILRILWSRRRFLWVLLVLSSLSCCTFNLDEMVGPPGPKILIYMTTHLSDRQVRFFPCWEAARRRFHFLRTADLFLFTSKEPRKKVASTLKRVFGHYTLHVETPNQTALDQMKDGARQLGAIQAMLSPFETKHRHWFSGYDWVIRLNPDVLIRDDRWLLQALKNPNIGAIVHNCWYYVEDQAKISTNLSEGTAYKFNTDFAAFRPLALEPWAFLNTTINPRDNAELHFTRGLHWSGLRVGNEVMLSPDIFAATNGSLKITYMPDIDQDGDKCRVLGKKSPVIHHHEIAKHCPNYFGATDNKWY